MFPAMLQQVQFLSPRWLWVIAFLPVLWLLLRRSLRLQDARARRLGATMERCASPTVLCLTLLLLVLALARPYYGSEQLKMEGRGRDLVIAIDISLSMEAKDLPPSRLEFAKRKMLDLLRALERDTTATRVGIVLFSGSAYLFAPLTDDYEVLRYYVQSIQPDLITARGSALDRAIDISFEALRASASVSGAVLLMTDGEDLSLQTKTFSELSEKSVFPVYSFGIGSVEGTTIQFQGRTLRDGQGNIVTTRLNTTLLESAARATDGKYFKSSLGDRDVLELLDSLKPLSSALDGRREYTVYFELGPQLITLALALLLYLTFRLRAFPLAMVALITVTQAPLQARAADLPPLQSIEEAYSLGHYDEIVRPLEEYARTHPDNRRIHQALGNTYYKLGRYDDAERAYTDAMLRDANGRERFESLYNIGNAAYRQGAFAEAIKKYEEALRIKPGDTDTQFNLALAKERLQQEAQEPEKQSQDGASSSSSQESNQTSAGQSSSGEDETQSSSNDTSSDTERGDSGSSSSFDNEQASTSSSTDGGGDESSSSSAGSETEPRESGEADEEESEGMADAKNRELEQRESSEQGKESAERRTEPLSESAPGSEETGMEEAEARAWLESLRDAPLLLQRKHRDRFDRPGGQIW